MDKGIETRVRDGKEEVFFKVSAMPIEHFKRFKQFAEEEWGGSYWHSIKFLLDFYELTLAGLFGEKGETDEGQTERKELKFLGGERNE